MVVCLACADINQAAPSPSAILSHTPLTSLRFEEPQVFSELQSEIALDLFIPDGNWQIKLDAPGGGVRGIVQVVGALSGNATLQRTNGRGGRTSARGSATGWGTAWSVSGNGGESGGVVDTTLAQLTDLGASKDVVVTWGGCATSKTTVANGRSAVLAKRLYGCRETCAAMATCVLGACENVGVEEASGVFVDCAVVCNMAPFTITQYSNWTCVQMLRTTTTVLKNINCSVNATYVKALRGNASSSSSSSNSSNSSAHVTSHQRRLLQLVRGQPPQIPSLQRQAQGHVQTPMSLSTTSPLEATLVRGLASQTPPLQGRAQGHVQRQMSLSQTVPLEVPRAEGKPQGNVQVKIEERAHVESQVRAQGKIRSAARKRTAGRMLGVFGGSNGDVSLPRHHHPLWHVRRDAPMEGTREGVEEGEKDVVVLKAQGGTAAENGEGGAAAEAADEVGLAARVGEEEAEEEEQEGEAGEAEEGADSGFSVWTDSSSSAGSIGHVESVETVPASNPSLHPFSPPPPLFLPLRFLSPNPSNTPAVPAPSPLAPTATAAAAAAAAAASAAAAAAAADTTTPTSTSDNTAQLVAQAITDTQAISQGGAQTVTGAQAVSQANTQAITGAQAITDAWAALGPTERQRWFNLRVAVSRALFSWVGDACLANVFSAVSLDAATRARVSALFCALLHSPGEAQGGQGVAAGASGASDGSLLGSSLFSSSDVIGGGSFDVAAVGGNGCVLGPFTSVDGSMAAAAAHFAFHGFPPAPPPAFNTTNTNGTASNGAASNGTASNETASSVSAPDLLSRRLRMSRDQFARFIGTFLDAVESVVVLDGATVSRLSSHFYVAAIGLSIVVVDGAALSRLSSHLSVSTAFETSQNGAALSRLSSHLYGAALSRLSSHLYGAALSRLSSHLYVSTEGCSPRESVSRLPFLHFTCRLFCDGGDNDGRLLEWAVGADFNVTVGRGDSVQFVWADDYPHSVKVRGLGSSAHDSLFKGYGANRMVLSRHSRCAPDNVGTMPLDGPPHPCALYGPSDAPAFTYTAVFTQTGSYKVECGRFGADMTATIHVVDDSEDDSTFLLDPFFDANTTTNPGTPLLSPLTSSCYPGCSFGNLADGRCDPLCNNHHCAFDGGDCECATLAGSGGGVGGECPCPAGQTRSEAGSCCPTDAVGTNLLFPFQLRSFGPDAHASNTQFSELYEKPLHRHVTERNRLLVGLYVLQTRWGSRECQSKKFASIWPHCLTNATSLTSFGINPRFLSTSDLYDPIVAAANQTGLENSTLSAAPLFNDQGLPYGFVPPMDGLESYPLIFDINLHRVAATKRLQYLVDGFYFDNLTKSIEFALITYNADVNMFVLSKIHIEVDVGGKLGYSYRLVPIPVEPYSSASSYAQMVLEIIYVVCVAYNLLEEVNEMFQTYRHSGSFLHHFRQFGNWIDLLSLSIQVWGIVVWIIMVQQLSPLSDISVRYNVYTSLDDTTSQFWAVNTTNGGFERAMQVYRTMDDSIQLRSFYFAIQGINVFLMVQRLLKLMDFQPRIGIITRTMAAALPAILHFFLVFGIIFLGFSFYGYLVFGRTLAQFRTIPNAMLSCFFMLIQDNSTAYYYAMLEGWERLAAFVFWLSFIVIMVFILMNVVIAIVVDAFMDVKEAAQEETALPIDIWILLRNLWQRICTPYWSLRKLRHHLLFLGTHEKTREEEEALATQRKSALAEVAGMVRKGCFMSKQERETLRRIHQTKRVVDVGIDKMDIMSLYALMNRTYERKTKRVVDVGIDKMDIMSLYALMNRTYERKNARSVDPVTIAESVMGQFGEDVEVALLGEKPKKGKSGEMSHIKRSLQRLEGDALHPGTNSIPIHLFPLSSSPPSPLLPLSSPLPFFPSPPADGPYESHQGKPVSSSQPSNKPILLTTCPFPPSLLSPPPPQMASMSPTKAASKAHQVDPVTIAESVMGQFGEDVEVALLGEKPKKGKSGEMSHIKRSLQRLEENADETAYVLLQVQESLEKMRQEQEEMQQQQQLMLLRGSGKERRPELGLARGDRQWSRVRRRFEDDDDGDDDDADVSAAAALRGHGAASGRMGGEFGNPGSSGNPGRQRRARTAHMKSFGGDEPSILDAVAKLGGGLGRMGGEDVGNTSGRHRPASFSSMPRGAAEDMGMRRKMVDFPSMGGGIGGGWGMGGEDVGNISGRRKSLEYGSMRRGMPGGGMAGAGMASPYRGGGFLGSGTAGFAQPRSIMPDGGFGNRKFGEGMGAGSRRMVGGEKQGSRASALLAELQAARAAGGAGSWTRIHEGEVKRVQVEYAMEAISHAGSAIGILATDGVVLAAEKRITSKLLHTPSHPFPPLPTHQVEYAMEAISHAGSAIGILATDGVVLAAEKRITSKLLESSKTNEKMYRIDDHVAAAVAGITADANILVNSARLAAQRYTYAYQEPIPMEQLVQSLCDTKQGYTQFGGLRPFGVSFLFAGWDKHHQFQLYHSDPSGNYGGWRACAIGANHGAAQSLLKQEYKEEKGPGGEAIPGMDLEGAVQLALKVLSKTMDSTSLSAEKIELAKVCLEDGQVRYRVFGAKEIDELLLKYEMAQPKEEER
ncbi:unnamed protein product [Closterium sp. NIES-65]|nr:unnamed protein product [Closterium sp. NIES-65]